MSKYFILVVAITAILLLGGCAEQEHYADMDDKDWEMLTSDSNGKVYESVRYKSKEEFLTEVDEHIDEICDYLDKDTWWIKDGDERRRLKINYTNHVSRAEALVQPNIYLNDTFKIDYAPTAHEIAHIIAPNDVSRSLREGLACHIQAEFGRNPDMNDFGLSAHRLSKEYITEDYAEVLEVIGTNRVGGVNIRGFARDEDGRSSFYLLSASFVTYLIDEYGIEEFIRVYDAKVLYDTYIEVYGKDLDALKTEWLAFLETQEGYEQTYKELLEEHIVSKFR